MYKTTFFLTSLLATLLGSNAQLNILARLEGKKYFGTAVDNPDLNNASYVVQLGNTLDFGQLTPVSLSYCFRSAQRS
jgi:endo-1,4-beta-xylanase